MVHNTVQHWLEEGPGEQPWNSMEASSTEIKNQGKNGSGEYDTN
jgi:hypothetical protein